MPRKNRKQPAAPVEVDAIEEVDSGGMGIDDGIVLTTFLLLATAVTLVYLAMSHYPPAVS